MAKPKGRLARTQRTHGEDTYGRTFCGRRLSASLMAKAGATPTCTMCRKSAAMPPKQPKATHTQRPTSAAGWSWCGLRTTRMVAEGATCARCRLAQEAA